MGSEPRSGRTAASKPQACSGLFKLTSLHRYEGEWANGQANGKGTYTHQNGATYEGQWRNNVQHGYGVETWPGNAKFEGNFLNGK